ncbi:hypothetical protein [Georgenia sp. Z1491]|uniref:hypothetical protein n=1 Tax=Georgenia sp. Z1491 TaxID=3416707 RepID=UPI003CE6AE40
MAAVAVLVAAFLADLLIDDAGNLRFEPNRGPDGTSGAATTGGTLGLVVGAAVLWPYRRWRNGRTWYEGRGDARSMSTGSVLLVDLVQAALLTLPPAVVLLAVDVYLHREVGLTAVAVATGLLATRAVTAHNWAGEATARPGDPRPLTDRCRGSKIARIGLAWLTAPVGPLLGLLAFDDTEFIYAGAIVVAVLVPPVSLFWWWRLRTPQPPTARGRGDA